MLFFQAMLSFMPFTPSYAIFCAIYPTVVLFFLNVMLCFLGKVEGVSRGIAVCTVKWLWGPKIPYETNNHLHIFCLNSSA